MSNRAIVTGGAGFIGSHLVGVLLEANIEVIVIDNFSNGRDVNLAAYKLNKNLKVVNLDIRDYAAILPLFADVDWVFHLAALADIVPSIESPLEYFTTNVDGTFNVLQAAREAKVKKVIYAASSSCYGIPDEYPTREDSRIQPQYPYALTKRMGEELVQHWGQVYNLPYISLRLFNVYGPRSRTSGTYGAVFGVFLAQKLAGRPFTVVGDGTQTRDFTYVGDVANAFVMAAQSAVVNETMNVGSGNTYSVNRLVELLDGPVEYIPKRPGEPDCTFADTQKIQKLLGWRPQTEFAEGVAIMLDNIEYWREAPVWDADNIQVATQKWFECLS